MSLSDAFLLEPYPFATYIANRPDGQKGSGILNDPWDGSTQAKFDGVRTCARVGNGRGEIIDSAA